MYFDNFKSKIQLSVLPAHQGQKLCIYHGSIKLDVALLEKVMRIPIIGRVLGIPVMAIDARNTSCKVNVVERSTSFRDV